jgi:hypothetical protein
MQMQKAIEERRPSVEQAMERLEKALTLAEQTVEALGARLDCVMRGPCASDICNEEEKSQAGETATCALASSIQKQADRANAIRGAIETFRVRLEI